MKKIMFNDYYGLTQAVLEGRKTQTRRVIKGLNDAYDIDSIEMGIDGHGEIYFVPYIEGKPAQEIYPSYRLEDVAIAQKYSECNRAVCLMDSKGWSNKMFVSAYLMPHRIRITNVRVERLQDISDEDCLKEGVYKMYHSGGGFWCYTTKASDMLFHTPQEAYAALIDKVSGKGTWDSNPYVFVYDFELVS